MRLILLVVFFAACSSPVIASKCYGEHDCTACKNCDYCKNCNSGGEYCGIYYRARGETPPWEKREQAKPHKKKAARVSMSS